MMERWIDDQVLKGNEPAVRIGRALLELYGDVPLSSSPSIEDLPQAHELTPIETKRFSGESRESLIKEGFVINTLTGQSIASLREAGRKFWSNWHQEHPQLEALVSMQSEVAINPTQLWLPKSSNKTLIQQKQMINKFSQELGKKIPGIEVMMGGMADYVDLAFAHLDQTGDYLFGEKYGYNYARTNTPTVGANVAHVGFFHPSFGLFVNHCYRDDRYDSAFAAPLVVPN